MSKFLSLEWFKNKVDHSIERVIERKLNSIAEQEDEFIETSSSEKPFMSIKLVNDMLTVVMHDGSIITK